MTDIETLIPGQPVPDLALPLVGGGTWRRSEQALQNFLLMVFYRGFHCPRCRDQVKELQDTKEAFAKLGTEVVAISSDGRERAEKAKAEWNLTDLDVAYDLPLTEARKWGLFVSVALPSSSSPPLFSEPGLFLVRPDGTLFASWVQTSSWARPHFEDILAMIASALERDQPARGEVVDLASVMKSADA